MNDNKMLHEKDGARDIEDGHPPDDDEMIDAYHVAISFGGGMSNTSTTITTATNTNDHDNDDDNDNGQGGAFSVVQQERETIERLLELLLGGSIPVIKLV